MKRLTTWITDSETGVLPEKRKNASALQTAVCITASPNLAASVAVIATSESFAMPPALALALPDTYASRQRALRLRWPWSLSALGNTCRHCLQRWDAGTILEGLWGAQQRQGAQCELMFARGLSKSRSTGLGRAGPGKCGAHNYHSGSTRLIVELSASRVPRRADSSNYQPDSSNYQPDSSNYQLKADNPAGNPAVSFVVYITVLSMYTCIEYTVES